jgi:hypothetical protein
VVVGSGIVREELLCTEEVGTSESELESEPVKTKSPGKKAKIFQMKKDKTQTEELLVDTPQASKNLFVSRKYSQTP